MDTDKGQSVVVEIHNWEGDRFGTRLEGRLHIAKSSASVIQTVQPRRGQGKSYLIVNMVRGAYDKRVS